MKTILQLIKEIKSHRTAYFFIIHNLSPIAGIIFLNWDPFALVMIYVAETVIIGLINIIKIFSSQAVIESSGSYYEPSIIMKIFLSIFFFIHFNFFNYGQLEIITSFTRTSGGSVDFFFNYFWNSNELKAVLVLIFASHFISYIFDFMRGNQYKKISPLVLFFSPYIRIFIQQFLGIFGAIIMLVFHAPLFLFVLLQFLKMSADVLTHVAFLRREKERGGQGIA